MSLTLINGKVVAYGLFVSGLSDDGPLNYE